MPRVGGSIPSGCVERELTVQGSSLFCTLRKICGRRKIVRLFFTERMRRLKKNIRRNIVLLVILALLCISLVVVLVQLARPDRPSDGGGQQAASTQAPSDLLQKNANSKVNALMERYFGAKARGDGDQLRSIIVPCTDEDVERVVRVSNYIERYTNIVNYTVDGSKEGTYIVISGYDLKLPNVDVLIPGMETIYVCTNEDGNLYINGDMEGLDPGEQARIQSVVADSGVKALLADTDNRFNAVMAENPSVKELYQQFGGEVTVYSTPDPNATPVPAPTPEPGATAPPTPAPAPAPVEVVTDPPAAAGDVGKEMVAVIYAPVYMEESESSENIDTLAVGKEVYVISHSSNGFSHVQLGDDYTGYVKTIYLASITYTDDEVIASGPCYSTCGGDNAEVMYTFENDLVYRVGAYGNGWSQIEVDGTYSYIKTSQLTKMPGGNSEEGSGGDGGSEEDSGE